jgi:hypothetical protein
MKANTLRVSGKGPGSVLRIPIRLRVRREEGDAVRWSQYHRAVACEVNIASPQPRGYEVSTVTR